MTDAALVLSADGLSADLAIENGDLFTDDGLDTAALISLFTDRRAEEDDVIDPLDRNQDRRGWAGDLVGLPGDRIGSRLWLLQRATLPTDTRFGGVPTALLVQQYAAEALAWMLEDGVASSVTPKAWVPNGALGSFGPAEAIKLLNSIAQGTNTLGKWKYAWAAQRAKGG